MDLSFDIKNSEGDHIMVALSYYDAETVSIITTDPRSLSLIFYDVTLIRKSGDGYIGRKMLNAITFTLARFMEENQDAVLCFYCDADTDVLRNHSGMYPQEYRSRLFSRMFESYIKTHPHINLMNRCVAIDDQFNPANRRFAHFICRSEHEKAVDSIGQILMYK